MPISSSTYNRLSLLPIQSLDFKTNTLKPKLRTLSTSCQQQQQQQQQPFLSSPFQFSKHTVTI
jgi:hypothetical protein